MTDGLVHDDIAALQRAVQGACEYLRQGHDVTPADILVVHEVVSRLQAALEFWQMGHQSGGGLCSPDL